MDARDAGRIREGEEMSDIEPVAWAIFRDGELDWEHELPFSDEPQSMMDDEESRPLYDGEVIVALSDEIERLRAALDALGVAIADAGYTWTPEMRAAYEKEAK